MDDMICRGQVYSEKKFDYTNKIGERQKEDYKWHKKKSKDL